MSNDRKLDNETEWLDKALECYAKEKSQKTRCSLLDNASINLFPTVI